MTYTATYTAPSSPSIALKHSTAASPEICLDDASFVTHRRASPFGTLLGTRDGVEVYSSRGGNRGNFKSHFHNGHFTGVRWQCVELARRYLLVQFGVTFESIGFAYEIFEPTTRFANVATRFLEPVTRHRNGSATRPTKGSLLIWNHGGINTYTGHVAVIVDVQDSHVDIIEQNMDDTIWTETYSRRLRVVTDGHSQYTIQKFHSNETILGW
ncbi:hypothetical protein SPRG_08898 [Saprolegnia parasitica CBS 223.65]|uniref:Peptidase C51 domain-containing protein n=1 Tax=Saprolegnia parasitica (strain CBS 223.65) TaxID=695850 RepID=A0A067C498_SAPPC|nr:hypothetical protein SPRG_08898 [Saprolegnia parasitica CBS 223.65]KDO25599.1 hypothetical protein SPRG_08898 [Saprolegnia parasitica CBS 223.65]|eukprot:XP_012203633.1 hypothetical protein SPRG_08898 [Saprolegnia parasitica CBS 223.65]